MSRTMPSDQARSTPTAVQVGEARRMWEKYHAQYPTFPRGDVLWIIAQHGDLRPDMEYVTWVRAVQVVDRQLTDELLKQFKAEGDTAGGAE